MKTNIKRVGLLLLLPLLVALPLTVVLPSPPVSAKTIADFNPVEGAKSYLYRNALAACFSASKLADGGIVTGDSIEPENVAKGQWFRSAFVVKIGHLVKADTGQVNCGDPTWINDALSLWGYTDKVAALCDFGFKRENGSNCTNGSGNLRHDGDRDASFKTAINTKVYNGREASIDDKMKYALYQGTFIAGCKATPVGPSEGANGDALAVANGENGFKLDVIQGSGESAKSVNTIYRGQLKRSDTVAVSVSPNSYEGNEDSCEDVVTEANKYDGAYLAYVQSNNDNPAAGGGSGAGEITTPDCDAGGFSFVICPLINLMKDTTLAVAKLLDGLLQYRPLPIGVPDSDPSWNIYRIWSSIVSVANLALVVAFLVIIFSQATSVGLSNYGIKKMLPKILVSAIFINISYFVAALMIDISNLVGAGVIGLFNTVMVQAGQPESTGGVSQWIGESMGAQIIAAAGLLAVIVAFFLIPVLLGILIVFLVLAARTAILTLLVIVSPLAFAAWVLPNTEKYFKKWWSLFFSMLALYPMVMAVFGAATVAAAVVASAPAAAGAPNINPVIALVIQALPLFALPALFKASGGLLGQINARMTQGIGKYGGNQAGNFMANTRKRAIRNTAATFAARGKATDGSDIEGLRGRLARRTGKAGVIVGGYAARRKNKEETQEANARLMQQQSTAAVILEDEGYARRAAGVGGAPGVERARALAQSQLSAAQDDARKNQLTLFTSQAIAAGMTTKDFTSRYAQAAMAGRDHILDYEGNRVQGVAVTATGAEAALEYQAANEKNMQLFEEARGVATDPDRPNSLFNQRMVDRVIARNVGTFKGAGGFHLQLSPNLRRDNYGSDAEFDTAMLNAQMISLSNTGADNMPDVKYSWLDNFSSRIASNPSAAVSSVDPDYATTGVPNEDLQKAYNNLVDSLTNENARARLGDRAPIVARMEEALRNQGLTYRDYTPPTTTPPATGP